MPYQRAIRRYESQAFDLALLSQGMLKGADLTAFVERSVVGMTV